MSKHKLIKVVEAAVAWVDAYDHYQKKRTDANDYEMFITQVKLLHAVREFKRA